MKRKRNMTHTYRHNFSLLATFRDGVLGGVTYTFFCTECLLFVDRSEGDYPDGDEWHEFWT